MSEKLNPFEKIRGGTKYYQPNDFDSFDKVKVDNFSLARTICPEGVKLDPDYDMDEEERPIENPFIVPHKHSILFTGSDDFVVTDLDHIMGVMILYKFSLSKFKFKDLHKNIYEFNKNYFNLEKINLDRKAYVLQIINYPESINTLKRNKNLFWEINELNFDCHVNINNIVNNIDKFQKILRSLRELDLYSLGYLQQVVDDPDSLEVLRRHLTKFYKLNLLGLNQKDYIKKVIEVPPIIRDITRNRFALLRLNKMRLNKKIYIEKLLQDPNLIKFF
ncbi:hypothetical protein [Piscirickettsia litoralis]|uniref:Uncharacterized protein n=1 Tax=Piscirickettsia litoralis TaxID=1891921 RepID=A0ABX2ZYM2_9GAMM|nr:hypothetical protein [Piscirickettsia litoralis]ODN41484.1 hypothetical protein BGC07_15330 [Piscirickettsia litoralis]